MRYFIDSNKKIFGFDDLQISMGLADGMTEIQESEIETYLRLNKLPIELKNEKLNTLKDTFETVSNSNVILSLGNTNIDNIPWVGGFDSALKLDGAKRLAEVGGLTEVTFYDVNDNEHILSIADATAVALSIGAKYQEHLARYKSRKLSVIAIDETLTDTRTIQDVVAAIDAVVW